MPARLAVYLPHQPVRQVTLNPDEPRLLGRGKDCDPSFDDPRLSRRHARIEHRHGAWSATDLESKNGTMLNGRPIRTARLNAGDWLSLGGLVARFEEPSPEALASERASAKQRRDTTRELSRGLDPRLGVKPLLNRVVDSVLELSGLERGFVLLADDQGDMRLEASRRLSGRDLQEDAFSGSWGAIRMSLAEGRPLVSGDIESVTALGERPSVIQGGIRALVCVPLSASDRVTGLVYADSTKSGRQFTQLDLELLEALCSQAAVAIGVSRLRAEIGELRARLPEDGLPDEELARLLDERLAAYRPVESDTELARSVLARGDT
jgi:pSer/pThr/pTyr-binding forkhead associated (FHA) protein